MKECLLLLGFLSLVGTVVGQACPAALGWVPNGGNCYKFAHFPSLKYQDAVKHCEEYGATLVSVDSESEHTFITRWLQANDLRRDNWWTSGRTDAGELFWEGDGSKAKYSQGWIIPSSRYREGQTFVIYYWDKSEFGWAILDQFTPISYICEISMKEVYRISQERRGFDYGLNILNPTEAPRGPYFLVEPETVTILGRTTLVYFECVAEGNPGVSYMWYRQNLDRKMVPVTLNDRYTTVTGRLNIHNPKASTDQGVYQCQVTNKFGTILSSTVELSFGNIGNFSTVASANVNADELNGAQLECPSISGTPGLVYQWYKNSPNSFIRPNFQTHSFISASGKLLFSEVAKSDEGTYYCVAQLTAFGLNRNYIGSSRTQSRLSRGFNLKVQGSGGNVFSVEIQKEFIYIYPSTPQRGATIRMECFAYGSLPLTYSWGKKNRPFPEGRHSFTSANRILMIYDVDFSDDDIYFCNVSSAKKSAGKQSTSYSLRIFAKPYFIYPLRDQHVDVGSQLTWHCEATGNPFPVYTWYKNGKVLATSSGVTVLRNTLTISSVDPDRDSGMYQCGASNEFGASFTSAQLRVLKIKPSFEKSPMTPSLAGAIGGKVTIKCDPVGAPRPIFSWFKDDNPLNLVPGQYAEDDHYQLLLNGDLMIQQISANDEGRYKCSVKNVEGEAEDYSDFRVTESAVFYQKPNDEKVEVNMTVTLLCQASHAQSNDIVYLWYFNDHIINYEREPEYILGSGREEGYLYVTGAQFRNEGFYTCAVVSATDRQQHDCYLTVLGPPREPAGVRVHTTPVTGMNTREVNNVKLANTRWLTWSVGDEAKEGITHFFIQFRSEFENSWQLHPDGNNIPISQTKIIDNIKYENQHYAMMTNLKSGAGVEFRVLARNSYGIGPPSKPSSMAQINSAPPTERVTNVRGGGGSIGVLTIWWDPLPREDHNGKQLKYHVEWRKNKQGLKEDKWQKIIVKHDEACFSKINIELGIMVVCQYVKYVTSENYYLPYDVRIKAVNEEGDGPFTDPKIVMSAELLPQQTPRSAYALEYNATALLVKWVPVPNTRETAGGTLKGYKVNYWRREFDTESQALQNIIELKPGQKNLDQALIIGLTPVTWYTFNIQAYNSAGNSLKSEKNEQETWNNVPEKFPTEVYVYSIEGKGVRVKFRGISTQAGEEPLQGYKVQIWKSTEDIRIAKEYDFGKQNSGVIKNLNNSELYQLRVFAYSRAGQGERSSPTVYFTVGDGQILSNVETTEILAGVSAIFPSVICTILFVIVSIWTRCS